MQNRFNRIFAADINQCQKMISVAMDATVRHKAYKLQRLLFGFTTLYGSDNRFIFCKAIVANGIGDFYQILSKNSPCANSQMTHFRIAHLPLGQTDRPS